MSNEGKRRRLEGVIPDLLKRAVEVGLEKAQEAPDSWKHLVGDRKIPKELAQYIYAQVDETKSGLFRVVAKETREFLEHANLAAEMQKLLTSMQFEINTTIRFSPNSGERLKKPDVKTEVYVKQDDRGRRRFRSE